jgi:hypothetical protein
VLGIGCGVGPGPAFAGGRGDSGGLLGPFGNGGGVTVLGCSLGSGGGAGVTFGSGGGSCGRYLG